MTAARPRRAGALVALLVALGLALLIVVLAARGGGGGEQVPAPSGPALRLGGLARDLTVGLAARADALEITALAPDADSPANVAPVPASRRLRLRVTWPDGTVTEPAVHPCGGACHMAALRLRAGESTVEVSVARHGAAPARVRFRVPWPLGAERDRLLRRTVRRMSRGRTVTVRESSTSDSARRLSPSPPLRLSGRQLVEAETYGVEGARDVRELPSPPGSEVKVIAYALPEANVWYQLWIGPGGRIVRERVTTPNHLIFHRFAYTRRAGRR